jgi:hypothetical protein
MNSSAEDSLIFGYEPLEDGLNLPDPDDRHVLAAAIRGGCEVIVTFNLKDFPAEELASYDIIAQHPDEFLSNVFELDQFYRYYGDSNEGENAMEEVEDNEVP